MVQAGAKEDIPVSEKTEGVGSSLQQLPHYRKLEEGYIDHSMEQCPS